MIPKLRFQEFDKHFSLSTLENELDIFNGYAFSSNDSQESGVRWVKIADVGVNQMRLNSPSFLPVGFEDKYNKFLLKKGDYVVALTRPILGGKLKIAKIDNNFDGSLLNQRVGKLESKNDLEYVYFMLQQSSLISRIENRIAGTDPPNLSPNEIATIKTYIPSLPEQQKIASFLSSVDKKIQQLNRKKELLEEYKKGVMQKLFSQVIRFKDENGKEFPEWEKKKLKEIAERNKLKNKDNRVNFVLTNSATHGIISQSDYFDRDIANQNNLNGYYVVSEGDFVYNPRISVHAPVGPIKRNKLKKGVMSPLYSVFRFNERANLDFLEYYFETTFWFKYLNSVANFGARHDRMNISNSDFFEMPIPYPCDKEQNKITDLLKRLDFKIDTASKQLVENQKFKKGLLQQMFV